MSTGSTGNGLTTPGAYTARTQTFTALNQVPSATLNAMQDGTKDTSDALDTLYAEVMPSRSCTSSAAHGTAPNVTGAREVWVEEVTDGTTVVVIDDSIDWRDRWVKVEVGFLDDSSDPRPGDAGDDQLQILFDDNGTAPGGITRMFYSEAGHDGTVAYPGLSITPASFSESVRLFARDTDGALCMRKNAAVEPNIVVVGLVKCSPQQNH